MRPYRRVKLTMDQEAVLRMWADSEQTGQRLAIRARVVLLAAEGVGVKAIEQATGLYWQSCLKWRKRFMERGIEGLYDKPGRGRPAIVTSEDRTGILALARTAPDDGSTRWTGASLPRRAVTASPQCSAFWQRATASPIKATGAESAWPPSLRQNRRA